MIIFFVELACNLSYFRLLLVNLHRFSTCSNLIRTHMKHRRLNFHEILFDHRLIKLGKHDVQNAWFDCDHNSVYSHLVTSNPLISLQSAWFSLSKLFTKLEQIIYEIVDYQVSSLNCAFFRVGANKIVIDPLTKKRSPRKNVFWDVFFVEAFCVLTRRRKGF